MDGIAAVRVALTSFPPLTALVPEDDIQAGDLPIEATLPAISLGMISRAERQPLKFGGKRHVTERVQATIHAADLPAQKQIETALRRAAAAHRFPAVPGIERVTIHTDGAGPDGMNETASIYRTAQDFIVTYSEDT